MSEAVFGLIGVVVGVALSAWFSELAEFRRNRAEGRVASRMLERELRTTARSLRHWITVRSATTPPREDVLRFRAWKLYHAAVARSARASDWEVVSECYLGFHEMRIGDDFLAELDDAAIVRLKEIEESALRAADRLRTHASRRWWRWVTWRYAAPDRRL